MKMNTNNSNAMAILYSVEAEYAVLGSVLINNNVLDDVIENVAVSDFYRSTNRIVYEAMIALHKDNKEIDIITLTDFLMKSNELEKIGGIAFITDLSNRVPTSRNVKNYIDIVHEKAVRRKLFNLSEKIQFLSASDADILEVVDTAEQNIMEIFKDTTTKTDVSDIKGIFQDAFLNIEQRCKNEGYIGLETKFKDLDHILNGLQKSDLIIIAARPSMGKTAFALNIATNLVKRNVPTLVFSLEMSKEQLMERIISSMTLIELSKIKSGSLEDEDWNQLAKMADRIAGLPLYINDTPGIGISKIRSISRKMKIEKDIKLIVLDYLQLISTSNSNYKNRNEEIAEISRSLKNLARELDIPIIALSQLSRSVEMRQDKHPILSDLRESGSIEQDADIVMFLYREDYYVADTDYENIADLSIAKHRNGATGRIQLFFHKEFTRFQDLER